MTSQIIPVLSGKTAGKAVRIGHIIAFAANKYGGRQDSGGWYTTRLNPRPPTAAPCGPLFEQLVAARVFHKISIMALKLPRRDGMPSIVRGRDIGGGIWQRYNRRLKR